MHIARARLANQGIASPSCAQPAAVVAWLGAMQAQDYLGTLWAVGLRLTRATERSVEEAIAKRAIVRTWPLRGTIHLVAPQDARWLLKLLTPRMIAQSAGRYRQLELDESTFARSQELFAGALQGGKQFTRDEMYQLLEQAHISAAGQRGYYLLVRAAQDGLICFGEPSGKQQTFTLLDEWIPATKELTRDEALAELATRYFTSHGPATVQDLVRWAGITVADAKRGLSGAGATLIQETVAEQEYWLSPSAPSAAAADAASLYLLPGFDEYILGYGDRSAVLDPAYAQRVCPGGNGVFSPTLVIDGQVAGTWKRSFKKGAVIVDLEPFRALTAAEEQAFGSAAQAYAQFLGLPVVLPDAISRG